MQLGRATGLQVAFFIFAVFLLTAPFSKYVARQLQLEPQWLDVLGRAAQLTFLAIGIFIAERFRPGLVTGLLAPIPTERRIETALVSGAKALAPFAILGGIAIYYWITAGPLGMERRFATDVYHTVLQERAFRPIGLVFLFAAVAIAPMVEEIAFRGLLYNAWERSFGWIPAMLASSAVFALFHSNFAIPFFSGLVYVCLYRRTGTLVAPIAAHAVGNLVAWYPLLGQHYLPSAALPVGDLASWELHFIFFSLFLWLLPVYIFMARNEPPRQES